MTDARFTAPCGCAFEGTRLVVQCARATRLFSELRIATRANTGTETEYRDRYEVHILSALGATPKQHTAACGCLWRADGIHPCKEALKWWESRYSGPDEHAYYERLTNYYEHISNAFGLQPAQPEPFTLDWWAERLGVHSDALAQGNAVYSFYNTDPTSLDATVTRVFIRFEDGKIVTTQQLAG